MQSNFILSLGGEIELGDFNETFDPLFNLKSDVGYIVDNNGELVEINNNYFGYNLFAGIGKIWPSRSFNSGLITSLNFGFWQHKISFIYTGDNIPGLSDEYIKGYDRLANGFMMTQKIGYRRYSLNNFFNFEIGVNSTQGFTAIRRNWIYDEMQAPPRSRLDIKLGVYCTFIIPIIR